MKCCIMTTIKIYVKINVKGRLCVLCETGPKKATLLCQMAHPDLSVIQIIHASADLKLQLFVGQILITRPHHADEISLGKIEIIVKIWSKVISNHKLFSDTL